MANVAHSTLTGADLHEPKGAAAATSGYVYAADGAGGGSWVDPNTLVTATAFSTGDVKGTFKTTADSTWVLMNDGTIGDASSAATTRANADCEDLFKLLWDNISDTYCPVSGGRGASSSIDWAAHKRIALPKVLGRVLGSAGAGSGLTSRALGQTAGAETVTLVEANLPAHTHGVGTLGTSGGSAHSHNASGNTGGANESLSHSHTGGQASTQNLSLDVGGVVGVWGSSPTNTGAASTPDHTHSITSLSISAESSHTHTITGATASVGSGTAVANVQPTTFVNWMIKL